MTYEAIFNRVKKAYAKAPAGKLGHDFALQFNITGDGEGIFYIAYRDGALEIEPYDYQDHSAVLTAEGGTFIKLAEGKLAPAAALEGGLLSIDGDHEAVKALLCVLSEKTEKRAYVRKHTAKTDAVKPAKSTQAAKAKKDAASPKTKSTKTSASKTKSAKAAASPVQAVDTTSSLPLMGKK